MKNVILIADDSSTVRKFVSFSLKLEKFDVITAEDGMDALEKISQAQVNLAIVDLNMPNMDGFELIETIRDSEDYSDLPIIVLTSERGENTKAKSKELGVDSFLNKPFEAHTLQDQVTKLLVKK